MICPNCKKEIKFIRILEPKFDYYIKDNEERFDFVISPSLYCCPNCLTVLFKSLSDARKYLESE